MPDSRRGRGADRRSAARRCARRAREEPPRRLHGAGDRAVPVPVVLGQRAHRARVGVGGPLGRRVDRARHARARTVGFGDGPPHHLLEGVARLLPRPRRLGDRPRSADDGHHAAAAAGERGRAPLHVRSRPRPRRTAARVAVAAPRRVARLDRPGAPRSPSRGSRRASVGVGDGQLAALGRRARPRAGAVARAPRTTRRRDRLREGASHRRRVPPLPRDRRRPRRRGLGHRAAGAGQPVRGRGRHVHRDHVPGGRRPGRGRHRGRARHLGRRPDRRPHACRDRRALGRVGRVVPVVRPARRPPRHHADRRRPARAVGARVQRRADAPDARPSGPVGEGRAVRRAVVGPHRHHVRAAALLARPGLGAPELDGRRRSRRRRPHRSGRGAAGDDARPRRSRRGSASTSTRRPATASAGRASRGRPR